MAYENMIHKLDRTTVARFSMGQVVEHKKFGYRGIIFDVDATFSQSSEWYDMMAKSRPNKDRPWYHILVDGETHSTYVAEENLLFSDTADTINHPLVSQLFVEAKNGQHAARQTLN